jgi:hypothetical protein
MKKGITIFLVLIFAFVCTENAFSDDIFACYQKVHGQLRTVTDPSQCLGSEIPIILNGQTGLCVANADLEGTVWSGSMQRVYGEGIFDTIDFTLTILYTNGKLFFGWVTSFDPQVPLYGAVVGCNEIRISTGQTVLFAKISSGGDTMTGYVYSTDPLKENFDGQYDLTQFRPAMMTFDLSKSTD